MPLTPEERARIARENGAKSRGPVTQEGKDRSRLNSLKTGEHATTLADLLPPDEAVTAMEDRREFVVLVHELMAQYQPVNQLALSVVVDIATATWQIRRYRCLITAQWNLAALNEAAKPTNLQPELHELSVITGAGRALHTGDKLVIVYNREIANLQKSIAALERRLKFIHANFSAPAPAPERTQPESEPDVENTELITEEPETSDVDSDPVVLVDPALEAVDNARRAFPGRPIVILPAQPEPETVNQPGEELPNAA